MLIHCHGNVETAIEWILTHPDEVPVDVVVDDFSQTAKEARHVNSVDRDEDEDPGIRYVLCN